LAVILVVPMCLLCSITGAVWTGTDVNIFTQIGFVVLVGLAAKNAILIVEFAKQQHEQGHSRRESALMASRLRLRPILMTSLAFIFGVLPLVFAHGAGAEMRQTLGIAGLFRRYPITWGSQEGRGNGRNHGQRSKPEPTVRAKRVSKNNF
jgi:multidrug efflux pump